MKRLFACSIILLALLFATASMAPLAAQDFSKVGCLSVQGGDSLWRISERVAQDPTLWERIYMRNPFLQQDGRRYVNPKNGWTYVLIRPGEQLCGLDEMGLLPKLADTSELASMGFNPPKPATVTVEKIPSWSWWPLLILVVIATGVVAYALLRRVLNANPIFSRPAMVPGGLTDQTAPVRFQQMAARMSGAHTAEGAMTPSVYQQFVVVEQIAGRIWGVMNVRYADGREVPRRLNGERAFRALVRFPDGHQEGLFMLQGCGNDLRYGGISRYLPGPDFRFEDDPVVQPAPAPQPQPVPAPQPEPDPEPAQPASPPAPAPSAQPEPATVAAEDDGTVKIEFRRPTSDKPDHMLRLTGVDVDDFTFEQKGRTTTLRYQVKEDGSN